MTHNLSMLTFPSAPLHVRHLPQGLGELQKSTVFFWGKNSTRWLFSNPQNPPHTLAWRHSHALVIFSIWDFYFDISEWHILLTRTWTPALMLHLTNPCAKRKVLRLTKPKGKIYKMKSYGHYIRKASVVCERQTERRRQRQTAILTHNFSFSWPYHSELFSRPHLALLIILSQKYWTRGPVGCFPSVHSQWLQAGSDSYWFQLP